MACVTQLVERFEHRVDDMSLLSSVFAHQLPSLPELVLLYVLFSENIEGPGNGRGQIFFSSGHKRKWNDLCKMGKKHLGLEGSGVVSLPPEKLGKGIC